MRRSTSSRVVMGRRQPQQHYGSPQRKKGTTYHKDPKNFEFQIKITAKGAESTEFFANAAVKSMLKFCCPYTLAVEARQLRKKHESRPCAGDGGTSLPAGKTLRPFGAGRRVHIGRRQKLLGILVTGNKLTKVCNLPHSRRLLIAFRKIVI